MIRHPQRGRGERPTKDTHPRATLPAKKQTRGTAVVAEAGAIASAVVNNLRRNAIGLNERERRGL